MNEVVENNWYAIKQVLQNDFQFLDLRRKKPVCRGSLAILLDVLSKSSILPEKQAIVLAPFDDAEIIRDLQLCGCELRYYLMSPASRMFQCRLWDQNWSFGLVELDRLLELKDQVIRVGLVLGDFLSHPYQLDSKEWIKYVASSERYICGVTRVNPLEKEPIRGSQEQQDVLKQSNGDLKSYSELLSARKSGVAPRSASIDSESLIGLINKCFADKDNGHRPFASAGSLYKTRVVAVYYDEGSATPTLLKWGFDGKFEGSYKIRQPRKLQNAGFLFQESAKSWPCAIYIVAAYTEPAQKYGARAYRMLVLEAGMIIQNIHVLSASYGWNSRIIAGFDDSVVSSSLALDPRELTICALVLG